MFTGILRVAGGNSFGLKSRMTLIPYRIFQIGQLSTKSSMEKNVEIDEQSKEFSADDLNESMNDINDFIRSYSSSIGVDGLIQLSDIKQKILIQLSNIQRKILQTQMESKINLIDVTTKYKNEINLVETKHKNEINLVETKHKNEINLIDVRTKHKNEIDYTKWSFAEVSQVFLLDIFFLRVIEELSRRDSTNSTSFTMEYFPNCFNVKGRKLCNPSKSAIENLLRTDSSVWTFIKSSFGIKGDLPKRMNKMLLYEELSEKLYLARFYCLYLPSDMPPDETEFFLELSRIFDCQAEVIDVYSAVAYLYRNDKKDS